MVEEGHAAGCFSCTMSCTVLPSMTWSRGSIPTWLSSVIRCVVALTLPIIITSAKHVALAVDCKGTLYSGSKSRLD